MRISCSVEWLFIFFIIVIRFRSSLTKRKTKTKQTQNFKVSVIFSSKFHLFMGSKRWRSSESTCLSGTPIFPSPQKPTFPNSTSTRNQVDEEQLCGCATSKLLFIYLFICTHTMFSGTHPFGPNKGVPPLPRQLPQRAIQGSVNVNLGL